MIFLSGAISHRVSLVGFQFDADRITFSANQIAIKREPIGELEFENLPYHICAKIQSAQQLLKYLAQFLLKVFLKFLSIL